VSASSPSRPKSRPGSAILLALTVLLGGLEAVKLWTFAAGAPAVRAFDAARYWQLGEQVASGDVWMVRDAVAYRTPGYPWCLGLVQLTAGESAWRAVVVLQYAAVGLITLITAWGTWRLSGGWGGACAATAVCVVSAARASHASVLLSESLFIPVWTLAVCGLTADDGFSRRGHTALVAASWCTACLLRPAALAVAPAWLLAWWWWVREAPRRGSTPPRWWEPIVITLAVAAALCGPWIVRNGLLFGRPTLTVFLGREMWMATFGPGAPPAPSLPETPDARRLRELLSTREAAVDPQNNWAVSHGLRAAGLSDAQADDLMRRVAWQAVLRDPVRALLRWAGRSVDFWRAVYSRSQTFYDDTPVPEPLPAGYWNHATCTRFRDGWLDHAWESRLLTVELTSLAAGLGLAGLWLSPTRFRSAAVLTVVIVSTALVTSALEYPSYRYRMVLEPVLIMAAVAGWQVLYDVLRRGAAAVWQEARQANPEAGPTEPRQVARQDARQDKRNK
jgi:hypothetical protein